MDHSKESAEVALVRQLAERQGLNLDDPEAAAERAAIQSENVEPVAFSWGRDKTDAHPAQHTVEDFAAFAKFVCDRRAEVKGKAYFAAPFADDDTGKHHRSKNTAQPRRYLPLDLDFIADGETMSDVLLALQPWRHFAYTTASHTADKPRLRIVLEFSRLVNRDEGIRCGLAFQRDLIAAAGIAADAVKFDESVYQAEQPCFGLVTNSEIYPSDRKMHGAPLDVDELLAHAPEIAPTVTAAARAEGIAHDDPLVQHLATHGYVLDVPTPAGKLAIRCPNDAAHSEVTSPTSTVVLLPHFNGAAHAAIKCLHSACAEVSQAEFKRLAGFERANAPKYVRHDYHEQLREEAKAEHWPAPVNLIELAQSTPQPPQFILRDWLPAGYATLLAGHGGVGKSAIGLHLAVCIALGIPFFGIETARRRVLYLSCEDREQVLHWRLAHICNWLGIDLAGLAGELDVLDLVGHDAVLWQLDPRTGYTITPAFNALAERMKARQAQVLVVDGVSDAYGGNENTRTEVKRFVNALLSFIPLEGALLLLGHVNKPAAANGATSEGYSGSTQWHNAVRARWYLYPETEKDEDSNRAARTGKLLLELQKSNLGRIDQSLTFQWDDDAHMFLSTGTFGVSAIDRKHRDETEQLGILRALAGCADADPSIIVPTATRGERTAFHVLSKRPEFPESLQRSTRRFWSCMEALRQLHRIDEQENCIKHHRKTWHFVLTAEGHRQL